MLRSKCTQFRSSQRNKATQRLKLTAACILFNGGVQRCLEPVDLRLSDTGSLSGFGANRDQTNSSSRGDLIGLQEMVEINQKKPFNIARPARGAKWLIVRSPCLT